MSNGTEQRKRIFSGIQPTGNITIGNYFGALKNWVKINEEYESLFCVVDMHSITVRQVPGELRKNTRDLLALYIAVGLDPEKNLIYPQSMVRQHAELAWILSCYTYMGELGRMTQFKEKSSKHEENINAGLFTYPVLMAADILLFQADLVPIGSDQKQHLELTRDVAQRFNGIYGDTFTVPEAYFGSVGARIKSLQDPLKKMSKSDENPNASISLLDDPKVVMNKIKRAVTDSDSSVSYSEEKPGVKNLVDIYCCATGETVEQAMGRFEGQGYGNLKKLAGEALVAELEPIQARFREISKDKAYLDRIMQDNAERASALGERTLKKVKKKVGFVVF
ncbi:tryptophan--tRNA ligase [Anaerotalea alkaliphila]|uniref:Tryptophan--tRNA ligase n=1 Tax=Anaerotalea alkaliphila TaxID=2662126 RepID=A0A7X5KMU7_9FIRM|nr:tryptophan--tRNA ligase [Anaerotalea alkaliphila]NDL67349.1 tryptophan--tRNA ligase [Anaerotalea alkaliphila]